MKKFVIIISVLSGFLCLPILAMAQVDDAIINPVVVNSPRFFVCIVAGVILAIGFQTLLTMLSVASGISAVGNIHDKAHSHSHSSTTHSHNDKSDMSMGQKISSAFGIWTMITVSISLFFASMLAVKLSLVGANFIGVTLGLVIWAAFFAAMVYLEAKAISSLIGGMIGMAKTGLKTSFGAVGSIFGSSSEGEAKSVAKVSAQENARAMRKELEKLFSRNDLDKKINKYVNKLSPQDINIEKVKNELKDLLSDIEIKEKTEMGAEGVTKHMFLEVASSSPNVSKEDISKLSRVFDEVKGIAKSDGDMLDKAEKAAERFTPITQADIDEFKKNVSEYLRATNKQELQPEKMREDIKAILRDPRRAKDILQHKSSMLDHETIVNVIAQREDISREDAEKYAVYAEKALDYVKEHLGMGGGNGSQNQGYSNTRTENYGTGTVTITESRAGSGGPGSERAKARLQDFFNNMQDKKDYNVNKIKNDFTNLFSSAGNDNESLTHKLRYYNEEEMMRFITNNTSIPADKAHGIVAKAIEARNTVLAKADEVEREVKMRLDQVKEEALVQAENTRKTAATAAWWIVGTAVVSGIASALGGMAALDTWLF